MARRLADAHILRLDDLPKVAEADGVVYPIYLRLRDIARVFHVAPGTVKRWVINYNLPVARIGPSIFIEVAAFNEWVTANSYTASEADEYWRAYRAQHSGPRIGRPTVDESDLDTWSAEDEDERAPSA